MGSEHFCIITLVSNAVSYGIFKKLSNYLKYTNKNIGFYLAS